MMETTKIGKQMIDFQKKAFDNAFDTAMIIRDQTEKMMNSFVDRAPWIPEEGKKTIQQWVESYNKGCEDYKKSVDEGFANFGTFYTVSEKAKSAKTE